MPVLARLWLMVKEEPTPIKRFWLAFSVSASSAATVVFTVLELMRTGRPVAASTKVALAVLGTLGPQELANAIALQNWAAVEQAPGVGKKLAQRIVAELKDKAPALTVAALGGPGGAKKGGAAAPVGDAAAEAISALTNLGYQPGQASQAVAVAIHELGEAVDTAKLIRRGLKELSR